MDGSEDLRRIETALLTGAQDGGENLLRRSSGLLDSIICQAWPAWGGGVRQRAFRQPSHTPLIVPIVLLPVLGVGRAPRLRMRSSTAASANDRRRGSARGKVTSWPDAVTALPDRSELHCHGGHARRCRRRSLKQWCDRYPTTPP